MFGEEIFLGIWGRPLDTQQNAALDLVHQLGTADLQGGQSPRACGYSSLLEALRFGRLTQISSTCKSGLARRFGLL